MITLLHGDHTQASRTELLRLIGQHKGAEVRSLDGSKLDETELSQAIESSSLFGGEILVVIENVLRKYAKLPKALAKLAHIIRSTEVADVILWENKEVSDAQIKLLGPGIQAKKFSIPKVLFAFLDSLAPGEAGTTLPLYETLTRAEAPELVYTMIARRMHQLAILSGGGDIPGLAPWQRSRLTSQAKRFTMEKLQASLSQLLMHEYRLKTGMTPFSLKQLTEQFLVDI